MAGACLRSWTVLRRYGSDLELILDIENHVLTNAVWAQAISMACVLIPAAKSPFTDRLSKVIGSVSTMLRLIYGDRYTKSDTQSNVTSIAFAGTVVGHLAFGFLSDRWSRRNSLLISTVST